MAEYITVLPSQEVLIKKLKTAIVSDQRRLESEDEA